MHTWRAGVTVFIVLVGPGANSRGDLVGEFDDLNQIGNLKVIS